MTSFESKSRELLAAAGRGAALSAFTLVELLLVIAIIAIMASLVISAFSNASADSRLVLARQQQAVVQQAVNSWIAYQSAASRSLDSARTEYNTTHADGGGRAVLELVRDYLDDATFDHLDSNTSNDAEVRSDAMVKTSQYLDISDWPDNSYPKVTLTSSP
jgi:prepilin-type N-terminal cleavage/methylation domain-containing protein